MGGHDFGRELGHTIGFDGRKLPVLDTTFGDRGRDQKSRWFSWIISGVFTTRFHDRQTLDYSQVDSQASKYKSVNFGAEKRSSSPSQRDQMGCDRAG